MRLFRQVTMNDELLEKFPFRTELSMQSYVLEHPQILKLDGKYDEVEICEEESTIKGGGRKDKKDGRIDMVATYAGEHIAIIEFKKDKLGDDSLDQLESYLEQKKELENLTPYLLLKDQNKKPKWIGILVGSSIDPKLEKKISDGYDYKGIPIAAITIERFRSATGNVYITTDIYFKRKSGRDFTQYEFNGELYGKGRLVLAVVKAHVARHPHMTYKQLENTFSKKNVGNSVFDRLSIAEKINENKSTKRHYIKEDEIIQLGDGPIAVTDQWGIDNIKGFIKRAKDRGHKIYPASS